MPKLSVLSLPALQKQTSINSWNEVLPFTLSRVELLLLAHQQNEKKRAMMNCRCVNINGKSIATDKKSVLHKLFYSSFMTNNVSNFTHYKAHLRSHLTVHYNWIIFHIRKYF